MEKLYKTVDEQIEYLKSSKKISVNPEHKYIFHERSYSSLINPYKEFFSYGRNQRGEHIYKKDTNFEEILKIINIDELFSLVMYSSIGSFERKFKTALFEEICKKYIETDNPDMTCTSYIEEIDNFLQTNSFQNLPRFALNFPYLLSKKGFVDDKYNLKTKKDLLKHIKELGTGSSDDGALPTKNNKLIQHYLNTQSIAPLWVIPNALTLGELKILYSMLDSESQKIIYANFYPVEDYKKISIQKLLSFSGLIELIRRIRNVVNHYEPIFPLLVSEIKTTKRVKDSQIYSALKLLNQNYTNVSITKFDYENITIQLNNYNSKHIQVLNLMKEMIDLQNKK